MQAKFDHDYVPVELLRTMIAIHELGSYTKAGQALRLTQSAISAQMKRLQQMVGGDVFAKSGGGISLTDRGKIIDRFARRILELNGQIVMLARPAVTTRPIRVGLTAAVAALRLQEVLDALEKNAPSFDVQIQCGTSTQLLRSLDSGYLDVAMVFTKESTVRLVAEWNEPISWMRATHLLVGPGAPLPYISWPDSLTDRIATTALEQAGLRYAMTFTGADHAARVAAAQSALGYVVLPSRDQPSRLVISRERFLPPLEALRGGIAVRDEIDRRALAPLLRAFEAVVRPPAPTEPAAPSSGMVEFSASA